MKPDPQNDLPGSPDPRDDAILVTGAGGFLGGHLVASLVRSGCRRVRAVDRKPLERWSQVYDGVDNRAADLARREVCDALCAGASRVYHLAADTGGVGYFAKVPSAAMLSTVVDGHMLLAARDAGVERFLYASSSGVYPAARQRDPQGRALREEDAGSTTPVDGEGRAKREGELLCQRFREESGLQTRIARIHGVHGPLAPWMGGRERAAAAICRKTVEAKLSGEPHIAIWGSGEQTRSFLFVDDGIEGLRRIAASEVGEPLNLGSDERVSLDGLVSVVEAIAGVELERAYAHDAPTGVAGCSSDNTRIRERLGWAPGTPLRDGLEKTYKWIHDEYLRRWGGRLGPREPVPRA